MNKVTYKLERTSDISQIGYYDDSIKMKFVSNGSIEEYIEHFTQFLLASGFHPETIERYIPSDL